jgi:glycosyltransferase involved in cell wall biosynthesis
MRVLIIDKGFHIKNKYGLEQILTYLGWTFSYGNNIIDFDIIYSPNTPINTSLYPTKKFIFGPHFSVFPSKLILSIKNIHNNAVYIQPSAWAKKVWDDQHANDYLPIHAFPFPVNTDKFIPDINITRSRVFIYYKSREPSELLYVETELAKRNIEYTIFNYVNTYREEDYINCLKQSKYGIIIGRHESQGFAIEEALSCNVPLLVWDTIYMSQEYNYNYPDISCTTIPYWDDTCGEYFYQENEFNSKLDKLIQNTYNPRSYIKNTLSVEQCSKNLVNMLNKF